MGFLKNGVTQAELAGVVLGQVPDYSITDAKLSNDPNDIKISLTRQLAETTQQLVTKATTVYVDTKFGSMGSTKTYKGSCLFANLPVSGMMVDDYWYITDQATNRCWNGTVWGDIGSSLNIGNGTILPISTTFMAKTVNRFDKTAITIGYSVSANGTYNSLAVSANTNVGGIIATTPNTVYKMSSALDGSGVSVRTFNSTGNYVATIAGVSNGDGTYNVTMGATGYFMRFTYSPIIVNIDTFILAELSVYPIKYIKFGYQLPTSYISDIEQRVEVLEDGIPDESIINQKYADESISFEKFHNSLAIGKIPLINNIPNSLDANISKFATFSYLTNEIVTDANIIKNTGVNKLLKITKTTTDVGNNLLNIARTEIPVGSESIGFSTFVYGYSKTTFTLSVIAYNVSTIVATASKIFSFDGGIINAKVQIDAIPVTATRYDVTILTTDLVQNDYIIIGGYQLVFKRYMPLISAMPSDEALSDTSTNPVKIMGNDISIFNHIVCVGDSLTVGVFNTVDNYITDGKYSYPTILSKLTGVTTDNLGNSSFTTKQWYENRVGRDFSIYDCAIIQLGVNDEAQAVTNQETLDYLQLIIDRLKADSKNIKIFIATITGSSWYNTAGYIARSELIRVFATGKETDNIFCLDNKLYSEIYDMPYASGHLTALGYMKQAEEYKNYISYIMRNNSQYFEDIQFIGTDYLPYS